MKYLIVILAMFLTSCLPESVDQEGQKCTVLASSDSIILKVSSDTPLPPNLSIALNAGGATKIVDECSVGSPLSANLIVDQNRLQAASRFDLGDNDLLMDHFFPGNSQDPVVDSTEFSLFTRVNCLAPSTLIVNRPNIVITWSADFVNGENCGKTGNTGYSSFKLIP